MTFKLSILPNHAKHFQGLELCYMLSSLTFYINYQSLINLTIKNWYCLPLICKVLGRLGWVAYYTMRSNLFLLSDENLRRQ